MSKLLVILHGEIHTPPMTSEARYEVGALLRDLQEGLTLSMPQSQPMPSVGAGCHELRVPDADNNWRVIYHIASDEIVILAVFSKKTEQTPQSMLDSCKNRLTQYKAAQKALIKAQRK